MPSATFSRLLPLLSVIFLLSIVQANQFGRLEECQDAYYQVSKDLAKASRQANEYYRAYKNGLRRIKDLETELHHARIGKIALEQHVADLSNVKDMLLVRLKRQERKARKLRDDSSK